MDNHQLEIMLARLEGKIDNITDKVIAIGKWQDKHENDDKETHQKLHDRISAGRTAYVVIAAIAAGVTLVLVKAGDVMAAVIGR